MFYYVIYGLSRYHEKEGLDATDLKNRLGEVIAEERVNAKNIEKEASEVALEAK